MPISLPEIDDLLENHKSWTPAPTQVQDPNIVELDTFIKRIRVKAQREPEKYPGPLLQIYEEWSRALAFQLQGKLLVNAKQARMFFENWALALEVQDGQILNQPRGFKTPPVDVQQFVEDQFYLGQRGAVRPVVMEALWDIFHGPNSHQYVEIVSTGAIGIGKNYLVDMALGYDLYRLSCYHNPQVEFGLAPGSSIIFIMQSVKLHLAKVVIFNQFGGRLRSSPYFQKNFPYDRKITAELRFPNNIYIMPVSGSTTSSLGMNVFGGILDEANFMAKTQGSTLSNAVGELEFDQAIKLYNTLEKRIKSRFMDVGRVPGKLFLVSSVNYPGDFTDRKVEDAKTDPRIYVFKKSQWESLPASKFSGVKFRVETGTLSRRSRILQEGGTPIDADRVILVPIEYKDSFERNIEDALRDLAGITVADRNQFIKQRDQLFAAVELHKQTYDKEQLFTQDRADLSLIPDVRSLINYNYISKYIVGKPEFACHIDLALVYGENSCGLAIGHVSSIKHMDKHSEWDDKKGDYIEVPAGPAPFISIDGVLEIVPPLSDEVDLEKVGSLIIELARLIRMQWVTADQFQSAALLQRLRKAGMKAGVLSVDAKPHPYFEYKTAIRDERLLLPDVPKLATETLSLIYDPRRDKVDHPIGLSKDLSDAVAGTVYLLSTRKQSYDVNRVAQTAPKIRGGAFSRARSGSHEATSTPRRRLIIRR